MTKVIQIEVNPSFGSCDCCNKREDSIITKTTKTFIDNSPAGDGSCIGAYWLCQECNTLYLTDKDSFAKKMQDSYNYCK